MTKTVTGTDNLLLSEVKEHLVVDITIDDTLIQTYIDASLGSVEAYLHKDVLETNYVGTSTEIEDNVYYIDAKPVSIVVDTVTLNKDQYVNYEGRLAISDQDILNTTIADVTVNTGYSTIPKAINQARLLLVGECYEGREGNTFSNKAAKLPHGIEFLLNPESDGAI